MQTKPSGYEADSIDDKQTEPPAADQPTSPSDEWLRYQQRVADQLAGGYSNESTRRIPPRPLAEAELTALHAASPTPREGGPLIVDYVATPPLLPTPPPAPIIATPTMPAAEEAPPLPDRALSWAKRLTFALFGAFLGIYFYDNLADWYRLPYLLPMLAAAAAPLGLAFLMRKTSNYAKWGAIAVTMTTFLPLLILSAGQNYGEAANLLQDPYLKPPVVPSNDVYWLFTTIANESNKGLFYLGGSIGMGLLAIFAMWKSLPGGWKIAGLLVLLAAVGNGLLMAYAFTAPILGSLPDLANILVYFIPILLIFVYLIAAGQRRTNRHLLLPALMKKYPAMP